MWRAVSSVVDAINATFDNIVAGNEELWMIGVGNCHDKNVVAPTMHTLIARCLRWMRANRRQLRMTHHEWCRTASCSWDWRDLVISSRIKRTPQNKMDRPLRQHITELERRVQELSEEMMRNQKTRTERNRIESELRVAQQALEHFQQALKLEQQLQQ